ncbi:MAG: extracellular solute-binding protein [Desulfopila sp.]
MKKRIIRILLIMMICLPLVAATAGAAEKVYVYNWTEYIPEKVLAQFTQETGIEVVYSTYDSNETMYAKLKLIKKDGYDVAVPSAYYVSKMRREEMLLPLNKSLLPNIDSLDPALLHKDYDKNNTYSIPYMWGSTGIGVNSDYVDPQSVTSWQDLWDSRFRASLLLQDDMREVFHMALKSKGYSTNTKDPEEIKEAYQMLKELMPNVLLFNSDSPRVPFLSGEVDVGMIWNGEAWMARQENEAIRYIYPKEGVNLWVDSFVIPKAARNIDNAHSFINFMLRPEVAKMCVEEYGYATPVRTALPLLGEKVRSSRIIFPEKEVIEKGEFQSDVGEALPVYQGYWEKLRSGN